MALKREDLEEFVRNALAWPENTLGVEEGPPVSGAFRMGFRLLLKTEKGCIILEKWSILWLSRQIRMDKHVENHFFQR